MKISIFELFINSFPKIFILLEVISIEYRHLILPNSNNSEFSFGDFIRNIIVIIININIVIEIDAKIIYFFLLINNWSFPSFIISEDTSFKPMSISPSSIKKILL